MTEYNPSNPFNLGIWDELDMAPPPMPAAEDAIDIQLPIPSDTPPKKKWRRRYLFLKKSKAEDSRFVSPTKALKSYQQGYVLKNTGSNTLWAM